jgi:hypothetical protein
MNSKSDAPNTLSTIVPTVIIPTVRPRTRSWARIAFQSFDETRSTCDSDLPVTLDEAGTLGPT